MQNHRPTIRFKNVIYNYRIIDFIEKYNLLSDHQFGFRQNSSTIHAVTYIYMIISSKMLIKVFIAAVFF